MAARKYSNKRKRRVNRFDVGGNVLIPTLNDFGISTVTDISNSPIPNSLAQSVPTSPAGLSNLAKGAISGAGTLLGQTGYNVISGGLNSGAGNAIMGFGSAAGDVISTVNPVIGGAVKLGSGLVGGITNALFGSKLNQERINEIEGGISQLNNLQVDDSSTSSILNRFGDTTFGQSFSRKDVGSDGLFGNKAKNTYNRLKNEQGEAIARAYSNFDNGISNVINNQVNNALANYTAYGGPITMRYSGPMSPFGNTFAEGGGIHIKKSKRGTFTAAAKKHGKSVQAFASQVLANKDNYSPAMVKKANFARNASKWKHADGGPMFTDGGIFSNGVTTIGNGGTHEQNPFEGVQMGVDNQGIPNLVEEGEVIFNDYVYSNRIKAPKEVKKKYKLRGNTFADLAENAQKESAERPNDPISQRGLNNIMTKLAMEQETIKERRASKSSKQYARGGILARKYLPGGPLFDQENPYGYVGNTGRSKGSQVYNSIGDFSYNGTPLLTTSNGINFYNPIYAGQEFKDYVSNNFNTLVDKYWNKNFAPTYFSTNTSNPTKEQMITGMYDGKVSDMHRFGARAFADFMSQRNTDNDNTPIWKRGLVNPTDAELGDIANEITGLNTAFGSTRAKTKTGDKTGNGNNSKGSHSPTWLRYAPVLGSAIGLAQNIFSDPDYSSADAVLEAANNVGDYTPISYTPIGNYLTYNPFDRDYYINKLNAQAGSTRRAITGQSAGNRATAMAGLLAADYNTQLGLGNLARQAEEYNLAQRQAVETFNRATNQYNSEAKLKADMANLEAQQKARSSRLSGVAQAMAIRDAVDARRGASYSSNLTNLFNSLGDIGREEVMKTWINENPALYYAISTGGAGTSYKGKKKEDKKAKGGYLTINDRRRKR